MKALALLNTKADLIINKELLHRNKTCRDFEKLMKFKKLHELCSELGTTIADLLVLLYSWKALLINIGLNYYYICIYIYYKI